MNVGKIAEMSNPLPATTPKSTVEQSAKKSATTATDNPKVDKFVEESEAAYTPAYTKASAKTQTETASDSDSGVKIQKAKSFVALKNESLKSMVQETLSGQSDFASIFGVKSAGVSSASDDDYWGVDATAQRIYDFARTLAGDDDSLFQTLKDAVEKGFALAGKAFSKTTGQSSLPEICNQTYDKVMSLFDQWEEEIAAKNAETDK